MKVYTFFVVYIFLFLFIAGVVIFWGGRVSERERATLPSSFFYVYKMLCISFYFAHATKERKIGSG